MTDNAGEQDIEHRMAMLIHEHADWLTGPAWMAICERMGRGHFDDIPEMFDADAALAELNRRLLPDS